MDPALAFETFFEPVAGMSASELATELQRLYDRQRAIAALLRGELPVDYVEDMLAEHGIDPYDWAEIAEGNLILMLGG